VRQEGVVSHRHFDRLIEQIFAHPVSMNIHWKDVVRLVESLGGVVEPAHGGREKVKLNGQEWTFHVPHAKSIESKDEVMQLRHLLERAGVKPPGKGG
jgi:hypothetical protein